jgi:hypothetical protein
MSDTSGRLTARGGAEAEATATEALARLAQLLGSRIRPAELVALLLVGDFGRGEGRVFVDDAGIERPFGDLDFLMLSTNLASQERVGLERRLQKDLDEQPLSPGLSARIRVVSLAQMRSAACSVFWCDARFGHKRLLGDAGPLLAREAFHPAHMPLVAARNHIVETGLPMLAAQIATAPAEGAVAAHLDDAIVGCGSALLLVLGDYHWSLQERQCRMAERTDLPERFRAAFHDACERRLRRDRGAARPCADLETVADMHLACERLRLRAPDLTWEDYPDAACRATLKQLARAPISLAIRTIDPPVAPHPRGIGSWCGRLGLRCAPRSDVLALVYPVVAYNLSSRDYAGLAAEALDVWSGDRTDLRRAFVQAWLLSQEHDVYAEIARPGSVQTGMPTAA